MSAQSTRGRRRLRERAHVEYLRGDLPAALRLMEEAEDQSAALDLGGSRLDHARVLLEAGLVDDAATLLGRAAEDFRTIGMPSEQSDAELDLARCELLRGRPREARALAAEVAARDAARGDTERELEARLVRLESSVATGPAPSAVPGDAREEALAVAAEARRVGLARLALHADVLAALNDVPLGRLADAAAELAGASLLADSPHLATRTLLGRARLVLAVASGDGHGAGVIARTVRADVAASRCGPANLDLWTALRLSLDPVVTLDLERAAPGPPWDLLQAAERWRAATAEPPMLRPPQSEEDEEEWTRRRAELRAGVATGQGEGRVRTGLSRHPLDAALAAHAAVAVSLQWIGPQLHALLARPGRQLVHTVVLGWDDALALRDRLADDLAEAVARPPTTAGAATVPPAVSASLAAVDAAILDAAGLTPADPPGLVIVPTGPLATLPWGMLPSRLGRPTWVPRSLGEWLDRASAPVEVRIAAVSGRDLPTAGDEVRDVLEAWARVAVLPAPAGPLDSVPGAVVEAFTRADLVHLAARGRHRRDNPLFSVLSLEGGSLLAHDVEGRHRKASQVVLSACSPGGDTMRPGDEPVGFVSSLLSYGVGTVVAPVSDMHAETARRTMALYHRALADGGEAAGALAQAVASAASEGDWCAGAFTCFGAPWQVRRG